MQSMLKMILVLLLSNALAAPMTLSDKLTELEQSVKALEVGRENRADYVMLAKALAREGNCYFDEKDYKAAMDCYERAQMEDYQDSVHMKNQKAKKLQKKLDAAEFLDEGKSEEAKAKGNELFKAGDFQGSLKHYTEAIASVAHSSPTIFAQAPGLTR